MTLERDLSEKVHQLFISEDLSDDDRVFLNLETMRLIRAEQKAAIEAILKLGKDALKTARGIENSDALILHNKSSKIKLLNDRDVEIFNLGFYSALDAGQYTLDRLLLESGASQEK